MLFIKTNFREVKKMGLFSKKAKKKYVTLTSKSKLTVDVVDDNKWKKCNRCNEIIYNEDLKNNLNICPKCGNYFRLTAFERIELLIDEGTFLEEVIHQLHLENIHVYNKRAEEQVKTDREMYDVVTARAVANLRVLSELCIPLVKVNGLFLAMKGMQGNEEAKEAEHATKVLGVELEETQDTSLYTGDMRVNLYYRKVSHTPQQYPRNYGQIKKKPL